MKPRRPGRVSVPVACLLAIRCVVSAAADNPQQIIVTGTVINDQSVFETVPRYTITAEDISARQPATVADLLRGVPGVDVTQQGVSGGLTFVSMRGGEPNFTVVMIDGVKVDDPTNVQGGGFDLGGLDPLLIERIDVYFGSYSAVYGSGSLGGLISITTRTARSSFGGGVDLEGGTGDSRAGAFQLTGPLAGDVDASIAAAARGAEEGVDGASLSRRQGVVKLRRSPQHEAGPDWELSLFGSSGSASYFPVASGGDRLAVVRQMEHKDFDQYAARGNLEWALLPVWQTRLVGGWSRYAAQIDSPAIAPGVLSRVPAINSDNEYDRLNLVFSNTIAVSGAASLGFGAEYIREAGGINSTVDFGVPIPANFELKRDTYALFGEAAFELPKQFGLIGTVRYNDAGRIKSTDGRIAVKAPLGGAGGSASLVYAEGSKLPSFFALGFPLSGNPGLEPETSRNYELDLNQPLLGRRLGATLAVYHNDFKDLIDFDPVLFREVNRASAAAKGADLGLNAQVNDRVRIDLSAGYLDTAVSDHTRLKERPRWKGSLTLSWEPVNDWLFTLYGKVNGQFYDSAVPTGQVLLGGYTRIDANVRWRMTSQVDLKLLLTNALGRRYEEAVGFSNAGREVRVALAARL